MFSLFRLYFRMEHVIENQNTAVKKVPISILHSEGVTEKENCSFLKHTDSVVAEAEGPDVTRLSSLGSSNFTRQREPDSMLAAQIDPKPLRHPYMTTVRDHITSNSQQPTQPTEEPSSNRTRVTTGLSEDQKREELAKDIMGRDKSLADILDQSKMKTTMDLMEGIFPQGEQLLEGAHQRRKVPAKQSVTQPVDERSASVLKKRKLLNARSSFKSIIHETCMRSWVAFNKSSHFIFVWFIC